MFVPFHKVFKNFTDLEVRKGLTGGSYCVIKVKVGSLRKKDLNEILGVMELIAGETPQIQTKTETIIPNGFRKIPVESRFVAA